MSRFSGIDLAFGKCRFHEQRTPQIRYNTTATTFDVIHYRFLIRIEILIIKCNVYLRQSIKRSSILSSVHIIIITIIRYHSKFFRLLRYTYVTTGTQRFLTHRFRIDSLSSIIISHAYTLTNLHIYTQKHARIYTCSHTHTHTYEEQQYNQVRHNALFFSNYYRLIIFVLRLTIQWKRLP